MVICIVALVVFGVLSIFSAKYRTLAKEAFDCVFNMVTLRPCKTALKQRIKSAIISKLMPAFPVAAKVVYSNFELFSWVFTILFFASLLISANAAFNLVIYNNCYGPNSTGFCPISR